jgi:hypothetical protein
MQNIHSTTDKSLRLGSGIHTPRERQKSCALADRIGELGSGERPRLWLSNHLTVSQPQGWTGARSTSSITVRSPRPQREAATEKPARPRHANEAGVSKDPPRPVNSRQPWTVVDPHRPPSVVSESMHRGRQEGHVDWIERAFGISPDGGNGTFEALIIIAVVLIPIAAWRIWRHDA